MAQPPPVYVSPPVDNDHNQTLNAISFGFIATTLLFALFLIMAIFGRVLRPHRAFRSRGPVDEELQVESPRGPSDSQKPELRRVNSYSKAVSVVMPGNAYPTYFANLIPSPLGPEGVEWPSHAECSQHDRTLQCTPNQREPGFGTIVSGLGEKGGTSSKGSAVSS